MRKIKLLCLFFVFLFILASCDIKEFLPQIGEKTEETKDTIDYTKVFENYSKVESEIIFSGLSNESIIEKIIAKDNDGEHLGNIYLVSGENAYGNIVLLIGIDSLGKLAHIEFVENGQSYGNEVEVHVSENYKSGLELSEVENISVTCGATYGAKTVKELVKIAYNDFNQ